MTATASRAPGFGLADLAALLGLSSAPSSARP